MFQRPFTNYNRIVGASEVDRKAAILNYFRIAVISIYKLDDIANTVDEKEAL